MIEIAGGVTWLRPHVKTHKMAEVIKLQMQMGISKFKVATLAEAEMVAGCGAADVLLAFPQVGPNAERFSHLVAAFPGCHFSTWLTTRSCYCTCPPHSLAPDCASKCLLDIDQRHASHGHRAG